MYREYIFYEMHISGLRIRPRLEESADEFTTNGGTWAKEVSIHGDVL
jgi:hypothetical protein